MDIGTGIAIGSCAAAVAPVVIVAIRAKSNGSHCPEHSGICERLEGLDGWLTKIEAKLDRVIETRMQR